MHDGANIPSKIMPPSSPKSDSSYSNTARPKSDSSRSLPCFENLRKYRCQMLYWGGMYTFSLLPINVSVARYLCTPEHRLNTVNNSGSAASSLFNLNSLCSWTIQVLNSHGVDYSRSWILFMNSCICAGSAVCNREQAAQAVVGLAKTPHA